MTKIKEIIGRQIIDSRGNPTVEVDIILNNNKIGRASVPSGASTGRHEAFELRDGDQDTYGGMGVQKALENIYTEIRPLLVGLDVMDQDTIDHQLINLDGTKNKERLGANSILATSMAAARAAAINKNCYLFQHITDKNFNILPMPLMNIINGGSHANNNLDIQEFMIVPLSASSIKEAIKMGCEIFHSLKRILIEKGLSTSVGDEGGFSPDLKSNEEALDLMVSAVELARYKPGKDVYFALDCASTEYYADGIYKLDGGCLKLSSSSNLEYLTRLIAAYPIISIEDAMAEDDWEGWSLLTKTLGRSIQLVGDDLFVTNQERIKKGIERNCANSVLIKPNQIGTISETLQSILFSQKNGLTPIMSHRSGETEDTFIADLSVATGCNQIKTGSLSRSERLSKYNQLIRIEEVLGHEGKFWGINAFSHLNS